MNKHPIKKLLCLSAALIFVLGLTKAQADGVLSTTITITDAEGSNPIVNVGDLASPSVTLLPDYAQITGLLNSTNSTHTVDSGLVVLLDADATNSDFVEFVSGVPAAGSQSITITFESDAAASFSADLAAAQAKFCPSLSCTPLLENGAVQDLSNLLASPFDPISASNVFVKVQSSEVPEPQTLLLLGSGLIGLVSSLKRKIA